MADRIIRLRLTPGVLRSGLAAVFFFVAVGELDSENVTLTTYYPAPSGVYTQMITTGNTFLARDGGNVAIGLGTETMHDVQLHVNHNEYVSMRLSSRQGTNAALQLYDNANVTSHVPHEGWAILKNGTGDLLINRDTIEATGTRTDIKIKRDTGVVQISTMDVTGTFRLTSGSPVAGQVLTTNAQGVGTWQNSSLSHSLVCVNVESGGQWADCPAGYEVTGCSVFNSSEDSQIRPHLGKDACNNDENHVAARCCRF